MNEKIIVQISEIILAITALSMIAVVLAATWHDLHLIAQKKRFKAVNANVSKSTQGIYTDQTIRMLPHYFMILSRNMINKALAWHTPDNIITHSSFATNVLIRAISSIGLAVFISMLTYSFYTAATLQSNTLLTLSWSVVSLWLVAVVWSDGNLKFSKKSELTFTIPFMYFVFYALAILQFIVNIGRLVTAISLPRINVKNIHDAFLSEAYSTKF